MSTLGQHSRQEILSQRLAWQSALDSVRAQSAALRSIFVGNAKRDLLFIACGSPYFLGLSAAAYAQAILNVRSRAVPSSEIVYFADCVLTPGPPPLAIVISRSGETSETIAAMRLLQQRSADVLAIGCDAQTTILRAATLAIEVGEGREVSVAQTRSFSGMLLAAQALIALAAGRQDVMQALECLPGLADAFVQRAWAATASLISKRRIERFFFLGSGTRYGLACEAMLKMKEMSLSHAEAFHTLEFRHGPMSMVDEHTLVVGLISEQAADAELAVLREMRSLGGQTLAVGESEDVLRGSADTVIAFDSGLPATARDVLYMPVVQSLAYHRSVSKGLDCDKPRHLLAYVKLPDVE